MPSNTPENKSVASSVSNVAAAAGNGDDFTAEELEGLAQESRDALRNPSAPAHHDSFLRRLTTGTGSFDILGPRRWYYILSTVLVLASILFMVVRGFNLGIDFAGGTKIIFQPSSNEQIDKTHVAEVFDSAVASVAGQTPVESESVQTVGSSLQISSKALSPEQITAVKTALTDEFHPTDAISDAAVSNTWGSEISSRAILAVIVFLILVSVFIWIRYEIRVAAGAVASTIHDMVVTAGLYAAVGFEVTPSTVIGLLTILGFSLYDTVVVYDKVQENVKGLLQVTRRTYPEAANLAINQTLMRSVNTSLIALLPVAGLLVAGVAILGSGTLKDLSLVLLIGMLVGAYSSIFVAVPLAVDFKIRQPEIKAHIAKVLAKRDADGVIVDAIGDPIAGGRAAAPARVLVSAGAAAPQPHTAPKPGAKPVRVAAPKPPASPAKTAKTVPASKSPASKAAATPAPKATATPAPRPAATPALKATTPALKATATPAPKAAATPAPKATAKRTVNPEPAASAPEPARTSGAAAKPADAAEPAAKATASSAARPARPTGKSGASRPTGKRSR